MDKSYWLNWLCISSGNLETSNLQRKQFLLSLRVKIPPISSPGQMRILELESVARKQPAYR